MLHEITLEFDLLDILQLQDWIKNYNNRLATIIEGCGYEDIVRKLTIVATEQLSNQDMQDISQAIASYTNPTVPPDYRIVNTGLQKIDVQSSNFKTIFEYEYQKNTFWKISEFHIRSLSILTPSTSSITYTIRIVNVTTNQVIGSETFTSSSEYAENVVMIDENVNFSSTQSLEIQVKIDSQSFGNTPGTVSILSTHIREENET